MTTARYLYARTRPVVPKARAAGDVLHRDPVAANLLLAAKANNARLAAVKLAVPKSLHDQMAAGGLDETGWTLLVRNAAAAAKLRQLQPSLELLLSEGFGPCVLRIKLCTAP
jgi:hypothetical protein